MVDKHLSAKHLPVIPDGVGEHCCDLGHIASGGRILGVQTIGRCSKIARLQEAVTRTTMHLIV